MKPYSCAQATSLTPLISVCAHHRGRNAEAILDLIAGDIVDVTAEELAFVEQAVDGQADVSTGHLSSALHNDCVFVKGVMHHHQDYRFSPWTHGTDQRESAVEASSVWPVFI